MKRYLVANVATMVMALFLAVLTWIYLFTQGNGQEIVDVAFQPRVDLQEIASVSYRTTDGQELAPGGALKVRVVGPKTDIRLIKLRPKILPCEFMLDAKQLDAPQGTLTFPLMREYFNMPSNINVDPLPVLKIEYSKYLEQEIELIADRTTYEGKGAADGYEIESITPSPARIRVKLPANRAGTNRVSIRPVPIENKFESFPLVPWFLDTTAERLNIQPLEPFTVEVKIVPKPFSKQVRTDLHVSAKSEHLSRIGLDSISITIELTGPKELVEEAAKQPAAFVPYVVVTDKDIVGPPGPRNISELGCHILEPKYQGKIRVLVMADVKPENRQVKIQVK